MINKSSSIVTAADRGREAGGRAGGRASERASRQRSTRQSGGELALNTRPSAGVVYVSGATVPFDRAELSLSLSLSPLAARQWTGLDRRNVPLPRSYTHTRTHARTRLLKQKYDTTDRRPESRYVPITPGTRQTDGQQTDQKQTNTPEANCK